MKNLYHGISHKSGRSDFWENNSHYKEKYETQEKAGIDRKNEIHVDETRNWQTNSKISTLSMKCK